MTVVFVIGFSLMAVLTYFGIREMRKAERHLREAKRLTVELLRRV